MPITNLLRKKSRKVIPSRTALKTIKYLKINLTKGVKGLYGEKLRHGEKGLEKTFHTCGLTDQYENTLSHRVMRSQYNLHQNYSDTLYRT